jgi:hypothetical protein
MAGNRNTVKLKITQMMLKPEDRHTRHHEPQERQDVHHP